MRWVRIRYQSYSYRPTHCQNTQTFFSSIHAMVSWSVACSCSPRPPVSYAPLIGYDPHGIKRRVAGAALVRIAYFIRTITFRRKDARERCRGKGSRAGNSPWPRSEPWDRIDGCASQGTTIRSGGLETGTGLGLETGTQLVLASLPAFSRKSRRVCRACDDAPPVHQASPGRHRGSCDGHAKRCVVEDSTHPTRLPVCSPVVLESGLLFG